MCLMGYCMTIGALRLWIAAFFLPHSIAWGQMGAKVWWSHGYAIFFSGVLGHICW
jgi:hypothetical protein